MIGSIGTVEMSVDIVVGSTISRSGAETGMVEHKVDYNGVKVGASWLCEGSDHS